MRAFVTRGGVARQGAGVQEVCVGAVAQTGGGDPFAAVERGRGGLGVEALDEVQGREGGVVDGVEFADDGGVGRRDQAGERAQVNQASGDERRAQEAGVLEAPVETEALEQGAVDEERVTGMGMGCVGHGVGSLLIWDWTERGAGPDRVFRGNWGLG